MNGFDRIRVGIVGLGRSGWGIHAQTLQALEERYTVAAVCDPDEARARAAGEQLAARAHTRFDELVAEEVDVIVVASPNRLHGEHTKTALRAGKHVVCDKPVGMSVAELDEMIDAAEKAGCILAPFQQRRYEPHFQKVRQIVQSGLLGRIVQIRLTWHGFKRRWDWQTLQEFGGGNLNNNGPHLIDHAMAFVPEDSEPEVSCDMRCCITLGDADDHLKIVLRAPGAPTVDIELSDAVAYAQDRWHISGTAGGLRGTERALQWKWVDWSQCPDRQVERDPTPDRSYNKEELPWQEQSWEDDTPDVNQHTRRRFYEDLYATLRGNQPLFVTPESVRRRMWLIDRCREVAMTDEPAAAHA